jgi:hypothetical protein
MARELGVQYVLEGSVRRDAERVRITAQLIQVKDQTHLSCRQYFLDHLWAPFPRDALEFQPNGVVRQGRAFTISFRRTTLASRFLEASWP